jgi:ferredoxin
VFCPYLDRRSGTLVSASCAPRWLERARPHSCSPRTRNVLTALHTGTVHPGPGGTLPGPGYCFLRDASPPGRAVLPSSRIDPHPGSPPASWARETAMSKALLYDATLCIGCKQCEGACAQQNNLPYDDTVAAEPVQSAHKYTVVLNKNDKYMRRLCMHCEEPACASVCPVGALHKTKAGPVVYDVWKCIGCRYCMVACPFSQPKYEWQR